MVTLMFGPRSPSLKSLVAGSGSGIHLPFRRLDEGIHTSFARLRFFYLELIIDAYLAYDTTLR